MTSSSGYTETSEVIDGVPAIRRRRNFPAKKASEPYLHIPMQCLEALAGVELPTSAVFLALRVIWHFKVTRGEAASISAAFASCVGITDRSARRYAITSLEASGLFDVHRNGKQATKIAPGKRLKALISG